MKLRILLLAAVASGLLASHGCKSADRAAGDGAGQQAGASPQLPDHGFRAMITVPDPPAKLLAGQKATVQVRVRNVSAVPWRVRGGEDNRRTDNKYYIAAANRWLDGDGKLVTDMDGRYGLPRDLNPGEEAEMPLLVTAPKNPGEYVLEFDLVQEQVAWFREKGSETTKVRVKVER